MEVTRKNFKETLPLVEASIKNADFLAIDAEFTGLINGPDVSMFDSPAEYYMRCLAGCKDFMLIQFGLCTFCWDEKSEQYTNDAYNFYLFPRGKPGPERTFLCQSSSLDFLSSQGFDFNKVIRDGISFMTEPAETRIREMLVERQKSYANDTNIITIPEDSKEFIEDTCAKVRHFLDEKKSDEMEIDRCNAFIRRLLFQELGTRFKTEAFVETKVLENKNRVLKVTRITAENNMHNFESQRKMKEWEEVEEAVGFSKVARMISQSEKLVVGHNMLLDVVHTLNHFFQPVPADYETFKEFAHCMFPRLLDTKYMSSLPPFKEKVNSSVLSHLLATLSEPPFALPKIGAGARGYRLADARAHEAGFDAFVTGLCFLAMLAHLARMRGEPAAPPARLAHAPALKPFLHKLYLARTAHQDSPYINLAGPDPTPSRDHVFHLTFPVDWQRNDITQLFSPFGPIIVQFLDDTSAYIALTRRDQAKDAMRTLAKSKRTTLVPYAKHKHMQNKATLDTKHWRKEQEPLITSDAARPRQVASAPLVASAPPPQPAHSPGKVPASPTKSTGEPPAPAHANRKRTSSGVFQVDETEPPPKKPESVRSAAESPRKRPEMNGRKESKKEAKKEKQEKKVLERFEAAATTCVAAFKESDTWD